MTKGQIKKIILKEVKVFNIIDIISHERMFASGKSDNDLLGVNILLSEGDYSHESALALSQKIQSIIPATELWRFGERQDMDISYIIEFEIYVKK